MSPEPNAKKTKDSKNPILPILPIGSLRFSLVLVLVIVLAILFPPSFFCLLFSVSCLLSSPLARSKNP
jgi:hypothetical protein